MLLQQGRHGECREAGGQGISQQRRVAPVHDRADDRRIGGGATDPFLFQHLHQGGLTEAGGRLGLVSKRFNLLGLRCIADRQRWQQQLLPLQGRIRIVTAFHIGPEETGEINPLAAGPEAGLSRTEVDRQHREPRLSHLTGHRALPDQLINRQITAIKPCIPRGSEALPCRANGLMGLLGITGLGAELTGAFAQILLAVKALHAAARSTDGLVGQVNRVGPHVGDETAFVEALGAAHGFPRRKRSLRLASC